MGTRVSVSFGDADTEWNAGSFVGYLHSAAETDVGAAVPVLEGRFSGETMYFHVIDPEHPQTAGGFGVWHGGFQWGRRFQGVTGPAVHYRVDNVTVRVMPMPLGMLPIDEQS